MANVLCVLYDDPIDGYPPAYARDQIPVIERYYDGQTTPTPERIDFSPGELAVRRQQIKATALHSHAYTGQLSQPQENVIHGPRQATFVPSRFS